MAKPATSTQHCPVPGFPVDWETSRVTCVGGLWCFLQAACSLDSSFHFHFSWCRELRSSTRGTRSLYSAEDPGLCLRPKKSCGCPGWSTEPINPSAGKPRQRLVSWLVTAPMSQESWQPSHPTASLIPQARGGRAQRAVYLLLALCAAALYLTGEPLMPTARSLTDHLAALQIGVLLKGTCYLTEEVFHLQSRSPQQWKCLRCLRSPSRMSLMGLPGLTMLGVKKSMEEFSRANPNVLACREIWKLHILIPLSCNICDDLEKADSNIQYLTDLTEITLTRAGTKKRVYKHSLYAIRDEDNKLWHCAVEYATPLQSLYAMSQDECAAFSREDRLEQAKLFYRTLEEILRGSKECAGTYRLIVYEESGEAETHFLSREILWHLWQQQHEYTVYEGNHPHTPSTTLNSTELNLQISKSDLPQPLRSGCF
ncbi:stimulator of interferon genes protein isoform X2 [Accipiter gentilis]|uniref:stimulator of interferon genes protein isoform X2 n=1 Tax=Astur gentilis TaxID=8957 RepID=UPI002110666A|nr:stimulator of interferon genes protein isoform X2 [Accipiter gentilis]